MAQIETKQIRVRLTIEQIEYLKEVQKRIGAKTLGDTLRFLVEFFMMLDKGEYAIFSPEGWKKAKIHSE
jgi:hypothetical protein